MLNLRNPKSNLNIIKDKSKHNQRVQRFFCVFRISSRGIKWLLELDWLNKKKVLV